MGLVIKKSDVRRMYPSRDPKSHKGQNGRVLIIGGSQDFFGAPILSALGALYSGADLVTLLTPECNFEVSRSFYPDFIVRKYGGFALNTRALDQAIELSQKADAVLIGPGITEDPEILRTVTKIIQKITPPIVLDAEAIPAIAQLGLPPESTEGPPLKDITITPHRGEFDQLIEGELPGEEREEMKLIHEFSERFKVTILRKSSRSVVASPGKPLRINTNGNAGMTVGGSGDVLAGFVTSLIAQHVAAYEACQCTAFLLGFAADRLFAQKGYNYTATDLALELPYTIHSVID